MYIYRGAHIWTASSRKNPRSSIKTTQLMCALSNAKGFVCLFVFRFMPACLCEGVCLSVCRFMPVCTYGQRDKEKEAVREAGRQGGREAWRKGFLPLHSPLSRIRRPTHKKASSFSRGGRLAPALFALLSVTCFCLSCPSHPPASRTASLTSLCPPPRARAQPPPPLRATAQSFAEGARKKSWTNHPWRSLKKKVLRALGKGDKKEEGSWTPARRV
jgi:hypothetical protein